MIVEVYTSCDGDWTDVFIDQKRYYAGHHITVYNLLKILAALDSSIDLKPWQEWEYDQENPIVHGVRLGVPDDN